MGGSGGGGGRNGNVGKNIGRNKRFARNSKYKHLGDDTPADIAALTRFNRIVKEHGSYQAFRDSFWQNKPGAKQINQLLDFIGEVMHAAGFKHATRGAVNEIASAITSGRDANLTIRNGVVHHAGSSQAVYDIL